MSVWNLFCGVIFLGFVASEEALLHPCKSHDMPCLRIATQEFLEKSSKGIPQYDIVAIDPLLIPEFEFKVEENEGLVVKLKNVDIKGLKDQDISDFRMNTTEKSVWLSLGAKLDMNSEITMEFQNPAKVYKGHFHAKAKVLGNSSYGYELKEGSNGTIHFVVGPELIVGSVIGQPEIKITFSEESIKDADFANLAERWTGKREENRIQLIKKLVEIAYVSIIHNIRAAAKVLPKEAFFIDV